MATVLIRTDTHVNFMQQRYDSPIFLRAYFEFGQGFGLDLNVGKLLVFRKHQFNWPAGHLGDVRDGNIKTFRSRPARPKRAAIVFVDESDFGYIDAETFRHSVA